MLTFVKTALQIASSTFDAELTTYIAGAEVDLGFGNVDTFDNTDDLTKTAVATYCGYRFELLHGDTAKAEKLFTAYNEIKTQMGFSSLYNERD